MERTILYELSRRIEGENEDCSMSIFTTVEKAVDWIKKFGRGWEDSKVPGKQNYFFVIVSMILDYPDEHQPIDELYFYDQYGERLHSQPF